MVSCLHFLTTLDKWGRYDEEGRAPRRQRSLGLVPPESHPLEIDFDGLRESSDLHKREHNGFRTPPRQLLAHSPDFGIPNIKISKLSEKKLRILSEQ